MDQLKEKAGSVAIIADDLTSAADGGAPFQQRGLTVEVIRGASEDLAFSGGVIAVDCASRSLSEKKAAIKTAGTTAILSSSKWLYKTIDSTLRGNIKAEISAAYEASGRTKLVIAPAFPAAGRVTRNGVQYVNGALVCQSAYADDPVHPVRSSRISDYIPSSIGNSIILDAENQRELDEQVAALGDPESTLWVGSPGMALALSKQQPAGLDQGQARAPVNSVLVVVGSGNPVSVQQSTELKHVTNVQCITAPSHRSGNPAKVLVQLVDQAVAVANDCDAIIATGGDTMEALLNRMCIHRFSLLGEIEPGFPVAMAKRIDGSNVILAMKAGGFGNSQTLVNAIAVLRDHTTRI